MTEPLRASGHSAAGGGQAVPGNLLIHLGGSSWFLLEYKEYERKAQM